MTTKYGYDAVTADKFGKVVNRVRLCGSGRKYGGIKFALALSFFSFHDQRGKIGPKPRADQRLLFSHASVHGSLAAFLCLQVASA